MGNFNMLPRDIISDILTRLPTEIVVDCELLSKSWNNLISHQSFSESHLNHCLNNLDSAGEEQPFHRVTRMRLNPAQFEDYNFAGTCNGLVCLNGFYENNWFKFNYEPVYICNPITRECVLLPKFKRTSARGERLVTGFGYVSSTKEYKVVRMCNLEKDPTSVRVEVYTLGSGKGWRNLGKKFNKDLDLFIPIHGQLLNESLYWELKDGTIVAFDLDSEIFSELPESFPTSWNFRLGVLGGYLSATHHDKDSNTFEISLLKEKKEDGSLTWIKEFSLNNMDTVESLVLTGRGTVLCCSKTKVQMYDLNTSSSILLEDFGKDKAICQAIPHMNTLVSLKALGEENTKRMEIIDVPLPFEFDNGWEPRFLRSVEGNDHCFQAIEACRQQ